MESGEMPGTSLELETSQERFTKARDRYFGVGYNGQASIDVNNADTTQAAAVLLEMVQAGLDNLQAQKRASSVGEQLNFELPITKYQRALATLNGERGSTESLVEVVGEIGQVSLAEERERHTKKLSEIPSTGLFGWGGRDTIRERAELDRHGKSEQHIKSAYELAIKIGNQKAAGVQEERGATTIHEQIQ